MIINSKDTQTNKNEEVLEVKKGKGGILKSVFIAVSCIFIILIPIGVTLYFYFLEEPPSYEKSEERKETEIEKIPIPKYVENPINGMPILKSRKKEIEERVPLCVIIENLPDARPQYGLYDADMVYEAVAEGGITRFMAVFWSKDVQKIMPIRSARKYYVDWVTDIKDCVFYHIGEAVSTDPDVGVRQAVNKYGIKEIRDTLFWRDADCLKKKNVEHCAYTNTETLWKKTEELGWKGALDNIEAYIFKHDKDPIISHAGIKDFSSESHQIHLTLSHPYKTIGYHIVWVYDPQSNSYQRYHGVFNNKDPLKDPISGNIVSAKNVAIIRTDVTFTGDIKNRNEVKVIGSGSGWILIDGKIVEARWEKKDINKRTKFFDLEGNEFRFNRGQLWIQAMPKDVPITVKKADNSEIEIK
uniref:DUF3048 domain-containing protein n=1 Tax=candidate division CPR3 bacterium TaxID=2268181 RepID=A0A7C5URN4_UNCC3